MQTHLADFIRDTEEGREAEAILRACVHCGFCLATCPTYQVLGDELDSPRGRIYLIKQVLEGQGASEKTRLHLDRCLTCLSCETTCPSGVRYGRLVDIGRAVVERAAPRPPSELAARKALQTVLPHRELFEPLLGLGRLARPLLPTALQRLVPVSEGGRRAPRTRHTRRMLLMQGCVQPGIAPNIDAATARVLDRLGIELVTAGAAGCCGAIAYHLNDHDAGMQAMRRNIDAWLPLLDAGCEAVLINASGCGKMVKDYGAVLAQDPAYAKKAARVSAAALDASEVLAAEQDSLAKLLAGMPRRRVAFHSPCTLQHGQKLRGVVEPLLRATGAELTVVPDPHLCCGSAGTYSLLQRTLAQRLLRDKVQALQSGAPDVIATANIGCLAHLASATRVPVCHWIELVDEALDQ